MYEYHFFNLWWGRIKLSEHNLQWEKINKLYQKGSNMGIIPNVLIFLTPQLHGVKITTMKRWSADKWSDVRIKERAMQEKKLHSILWLTMKFYCHEFQSYILTTHSTIIQRCILRISVVGSKLNGIKICKFWYLFSNIKIELKLYTVWTLSTTTDVLTTW
jgi:hypothetical protein